jgi:hypothetical protein
MEKSPLWYVRMEDYPHYYDVIVPGAGQEEAIRVARGAFEKAGYECKDPLGDDLKDGGFKVKAWDPKVPSIRTHHVAKWDF